MSGKQRLGSIVKSRQSQEKICYTPSTLRKRRLGCPLRRIDEIEDCHGPGNSGQKDNGKRSEKRGVWCIGQHLLYALLIVTNNPGTLHHIVQRA